jgi:hypothetical protein
MMKLLEDINMGLENQQASMKQLGRSVGKKVQTCEIKYQVIKHLK